MGDEPAFNTSFNPKIGCACYSKAMLRVLTLSTLFPNVVQPNLGVFVERQTLGLAALDEIELQVVAPIGLPVWPLSRHPHYQPLGKLDRAETWKGLTLHRPRYLVWPRLGTARTARNLAMALRPVLQRIRQTFPFDVIDAEFFWPDGPAAMFLAAEFDVPFSVKARGADIHYWGHHPASADQLLEAAKAADGMLAVSSGIKADMVALGFPADKIRVHHTGIDLDRFRPRDRDEARAELGLKGPVVITPGALIPRKGQAIAIEAIAGLPDVTLLLVGDGPDRNQLERLSDWLEIRPRVRFLGSRPHEEMPKLLAASDVMLLPTRSEGLANVWVESLACGTPVVTTDIPGAREVFSGSAASRLIPRSVPDARSAVAALLADPPDPAAVRQGAEKFSWDRNSAELVDHLAALVASHGVNRSARLRAA